MTRETTPRVAVVTGGSSGIGLAIARYLAAAGDTLVIVGRDADRLGAAAELFGARPLVGDVGRRSDVERVAGQVGEEFGRVDVLVNCAGFLEPVSPATPLDEAEAAWDRVLDANLKGAFLMTQALLPYVTGAHGRVINISSIAAVTGGSGSAALAYAAAKAGLVGLTYSQARGLAGRGITVNAVAPGFIADTGFTGGWPPERIDGIVAQTPVGRPGAGADVAYAVAYLAAPEASFVTGQVLHVNGGWVFR